VDPVAQLLQDVLEPTHAKVMRRVEITALVALLRPQLPAEAEVRVPVSPVEQVQREAFLSFMKDQQLRDQQLVQVVRLSEQHLPQQLEQLQLITLELLQLLGNGKFKLDVLEA
jgi:hypothetical protein